VGIIVEQMEWGVVQSKQRNPVLADRFETFRVIWSRLRGIRFMLDETKRLGLPASEFREMNEFVVTLRPTPAEAVERGIGYADSASSSPCRYHSLDAVFASSDCHICEKKRWLFLHFSALHY
jgi:predicted HTH transcriptional regulator